MEVQTLLTLIKHSRTIDYLNQLDFWVKDLDTMNKYTPFERKMVEDTFLNQQKLIKDGK